MKRLLAALALSIGLLAPQAPAFGQAVWSVEEFHSDVTVREDGSLEVRERIKADFLTERHGIYRYVPYQGTNDQGKAYRLRVDLVSVQRDGLVEDVSTSKENGNIIWKIGDANRTMDGAHAYDLTYRVENAIGRFDGFDEIYWNVTGTGWDTSLPVVTARVSLPEGVKATQSRCYTGAYGSTAEDCTISENGSVLEFSAIRPNESMTVAVGFPKGVVAAPPLWRRVLWAITQYGPWFLPLLVFVFAYRYWRKHGDDAPLGTIVTQYEPPVGLTPAETRALLTQSAHAKDVTPTIVDLASRGYVIIEEMEKKGILRATKEYALVLAKEFKTDASLRAFELHLLFGLFTGTVGEKVQLSSLKKTFHAQVQAFVKGVAASLTERGFFTKDPGHVRGLWMGIGGAVLIAGFAVVSLAGPFIVSGALLMLFGWFMPKWSPSGLEAARHASGYKEFISKVEKYRAPWMEDQNIFFRALPYAIAFGLGAKWAKAFAHLQMQPPAWYHGANMAAWSTVDFEKNMQSWSSSMMVAAMPSSRSGSGGGGFSGGGFGGGGGGSW
jgi:hypothetical protein